MDFGTVSEAGAPLRLALSTELSLPTAEPFLGVADPLLRLALASGLAAIAISIAMIGVVLLLRLRLLARLRRERAFVAAWRPLMVQCLESAPERLPPLAPADRLAFLRLWNHYSESLLGDARARLNRLAVDAGVDAAARAMLRDGSLGERLMAVITLGHLGDRSQRDAMRALAGGESPVLSLAAARALLRIDPEGALPWFVPFAAARADWPFARVAAMLEQAGADRVTPVLAAALEAACDAGADPERLSRLLRLSQVAHAGELAPAVGRVLTTAADPRVIADALSVLQDPRDAPAARRLAAHESWMVRVAAAKALARIGSPEDRGLLTGLLHDANWWVRHRAAQALAALPSLALDELKALRDSLTDDHAGRALDQVIAERS